METELRCSDVEAGAKACGLQEPLTWVGERVGGWGGVGDEISRNGSGIRQTCMSPQAIRSPRNVTWASSPLVKQQWYPQHLPQKAVIKIKSNNVNCLTQWMLNKVAPHPIPLPNSPGDSYPCALVLGRLTSLFPSLQGSRQLMYQV